MAIRSMLVAEVGHGAPERLSSLTSLRAFAALGVVVLHTVASRFNPDGLATISWLDRSAELGYLGVPFFFMLSGFVLTWGYSPTDKAGNFYRRRFARVYPLHFASALGLAIAALSLGREVDLGIAAACLLLVQAWIPEPDVYFGLNGAAWSLSCEVFFYALSPFLIPRLVRATPVVRRWFATTLVGLMTVAALLVAVIPAWSQRSSAVWVNPVFNLGLFVAGSVLALAISDGWRVRVGPSYAVGLVALSACAVALMSQDQPLSRPLATVIIAPSLTLLLCAFASADLAHAGGWIRRPALIRLGEWSFAVYMLSGLVLSAAERVIPPQDGLGALVTLIGVLIVSNVIAGLAYWAFERPVERMLRPKSPTTQSRRSGW